MTVDLHSYVGLYKVFWHNGDGEALRDDRPDAKQSQGIPIR